MSNRRDTYQRPPVVWTGWHTGTIVAGFVLVLATIALMGVAL